MAGWLQTRGSGDDLLMICTLIVETSEALCLTLTMLFRLSHSVNTLVKSWVVNTFFFSQFFSHQKEALSLLKS